MFRIVAFLLPTLALIAFGDPELRIEEIDAASSACNNFSVNLLHVLGGAGQNTVLSGVSVHLALGMVYLGAREDTAAQMADTLGYNSVLVNDTSNTRVINEADQHFINVSNAENKLYTLLIANKLYPNTSFEILENYTVDVMRYYGAAPERLDFSSDPAAASDAINNWVSDTTRGLIQHIVSKESLGTDTKLVLVSAIYLKANWVHHFDPSQTSNWTFYLDSGDSSVEVPIMSQKARFNFAVDATRKLSIIQLPYHGGALSMFIILPDELNGLSSLYSLTLQDLRQLMDAVEPKLIELFLPKFYISSKFSDLATTLSEMGMPLLFSNSANLAGIDENKDIKVDQVIHEAVINVTESGTEASAATEIGMVGMSAVLEEPQPTVFNANHPFMFLLVDDRTKLILFHGTLLNPNV